MITIKGLGTALVTPFRGGAVDYESYRMLVRRQVEGGVDFLVPLGSTAETPCLSDEEKRELVKITVEESDGKPVVAGVGSNSLPATVANMRNLEKFGVDAYLVVTPFYNKPTQNGLYEYFRAVADSTDRQIVMYNVPSRTGVNMTAETSLKLSAVKNITSIKEASGNVAQIIDIKRDAPEGFTVLSGDDDQTLPLMASGADGVISVASNIAPAKLKAMISAIGRCDLREAIELNNQLYPLFHACFVECNPIPVKAALSILGLCEAEMRLPLTEATESTRALMREVLKHIEL